MRNSSVINYTNGSRVKAKLDQLSGLNPPGTRLILDDDESDAIRTQLAEMKRRLAET